MVYQYTTTQGKVYILQARVSLLRDGCQRKLYYFSPVGERPAGLAKLPKGYQVRETRHGLPFVQPVGPVA